MTCRRSAACLICIAVAVCQAALCLGAETTEFRTALLIGNENPDLESSLQKQGFLISKGGTIADSLAGIPHCGFHLIYFRGRAKDLHTEGLVPRLQNSHVARHTVLLFDLPFDDEETRKALLSTFRGLAGRNNRGGLAAVNQSTAAADSLAVQLTAWLGNPRSSLRSELAKTAMVSEKTEEPVLLRGQPAVPVSSPDQLVAGHRAGEQWLASDGMNFVWCPPGRYTMGHTGFIDTRPVSVSIEKGFWISKFELTRLDASTDRLNAGGSFTYGRQPMHPAGGLRIEMLLEQLHQKAAPAGWTYDLPTEAEWEYAARAGTTAGLPAPLSRLGQYANFADRSLYNAREEVHFIFAHQKIDDGTAHGFANIGRYLPNAWGIHDMFGNAREYCAGYYTEELTGQVNYHLKTSRDRPIPVLRGGSWCTPVANLHVAYRTGYNGDESQPYSGARLVIRQGERVTRTNKELVREKKAEEEEARGKK